MIRRHYVLAALAIAAVSLAGGTHAAFAADKVCKLDIAGNENRKICRHKVDLAMAGVAAAGASHPVPRLKSRRTRFQHQA